MVVTFAAASWTANSAFPGALRCRSCHLLVGRPVVQANRLKLLLRQQMWAQFIRALAATVTGRQENIFGDRDDLDPLWPEDDFASFASFSSLSSRPAKRTPAIRLRADEKRQNSTQIEVPSILPNVYLRSKGQSSPDVAADVQARSVRFTVALGTTIPVFIGAAPSA